MSPGKVTIMKTSSMQAVKVADSVYWVGAVDWGIRDFHGYATQRGTTYNAFLILADKITLIDTVKAPFKNEMLARIASVVNPEDIDYIVSNHAEMDHSGALPATAELICPEKIFASKMGIKALHAHFGTGLELTEVKTGDKIDLGGKTISFIETKMLHWPDSMFTYLEEDELLFSQDAFGMHLACTDLFVDEHPMHLIKWECEKYFTNILMPYSGKILALLDSVAEMGLSVKMIATDHGPVWRGDDVSTVLAWYREWSTQPLYPKAVIIYDTMWGSTAKMAASIADGIRSTGGITVKILPLSASDRSDVATEMLESGALIVGSPTLNNQIFPSLADTLTYLKGLRPANLIGVAFGSHGWSGEAVKLLNQYLTDMNVDLVTDGLKVQYVPDEPDLLRCFELGETIATELKKRLG